MARLERAAWLFLVLLGTTVQTARAEGDLRFDVVAAGALGLDPQARCERDYDVISCQSLGILPTLELALEVRPWRRLGVGAFVGVSGSADSSSSASDTGDAQEAKQTDRLVRLGLELRLHPLPLIMPGAFLAAEAGYLRFSGVSHQSSTFVGGSLGYDFELFETLLLGPVAKVEYFALDGDATSLGALSTQETAYSAGPRIWLGLRAGVTFGSS